MPYAVWRAAALVCLLPATSLAQSVAQAGTDTPRQLLQPSAPAYDQGSPVTRDPALRGIGQNQGGVEPYSNFSPSPITSSVSPSPSSREAVSGFEEWRRTNVVGRTLRQLVEDGVNIRTNYIENFAGNPVGGERQGFAASQWYDLGADFDMAKLVGWSGATVHLQGAYFWGRSVGHDYIGNTISFQQTWRAVPGPRLTAFNVEQNLLGGAVNVMVGRAAVNSYFATSPLNCDFMSNTSCLALYGPITDIGITAFPNSSWAGKVRVAVTRHVYGQVGAFEYNNALNTEGRDGVDFGTASATGVIVPGEVGFETNYSDDKFPRRYRAGFYYNSAAAADPFSDVAGTSAALAHKPYATERGARIGLYAIFDQTVWRLRPGTQDNLAIFGRLFYNAGDALTVTSFASAGFVLTGPFADRHEDTIGLLLTDTHFSPREIRNLAALRQLAGGAGNPNPDEMIGEINYGYQAIPGLRIVPNIQGDIHPDPLYVPRVKKNIPDALVLGLKIDVHFAELFGGRYSLAK